MSRWLRPFALRLCCFVVLGLALPLASGPAVMGAPAAAALPVRQPQADDVPVVDPNYIYAQLALVATSFQRREAGYDNNLPVEVNGHDEFADYWVKEITRDLQGFGPQTRHLLFPTIGWRNRPPVVPAFNVEVTVPGVSHAEQVVVIGCHYDGMAFSTQSANDDASGCAIELGVARAMATYWRARHVYPARTLRFVLFDAEEQGLVGSYYYVDNAVNGDLDNIVAMFNEEQSGIAYPLRFLGKTSNPLLPLFADMTPLENNAMYRERPTLTQSQAAGVTRFRALMAEALPAAFQQFQALGYTTLAYQNAAGQPVTLPVFTPEQTRFVHLGDDTIGSSDQMPFTFAGLACATLVGNSSYYDPKSPPWGYPYDQPEDTIQLMNIYASGQSSKSEALALALGLPGMLTAWMLAQPEILGTASADGKPIVAISDVGQTVAGKSLTLDAQVAFAPAGGALSFAWDFGDGTLGSGVTVSHTYSAPGAYTLTLTATSPTGVRRVSKSITVGTQPLAVSNPYAGSITSGRPRANPNVQLPQPENATPSAGTGGNGGPGAASLPGWLLIGALVLVALLVAGGIVLARRRVGSG
jgi:hypothetical protein